jgi:hypothetical protein
MNSRIRHLSDSALLMALLVVAGVVFQLAASGARPRPVLHPAGCHACSGNSPAAVVAAFEAELIRIGAMEPADPAELQ